MRIFCSAQWVRFLSLSKLDSQLQQDYKYVKINLIIILIKIKMYNTHYSLVSEIENMHVEWRVSSFVLTDQELERIVTEMHRQFPQSGYRQILALLKCQGIYVREYRLRDSLRRCDPLGSSLRWFATIKRRSYNVTSPLALWHLDGNHKLIQYVLRFTMSVSQCLCHTAYKHFRLPCFFLPWPR